MSCDNGTWKRTRSCSDHYFEFSTYYIYTDSWLLGQAMVLGSFQCRIVLMLWHMVGQGHAVLAEGAGWVGCFVCVCFSSRLFYLPFLMPNLLGDGWTY